MAKENATKITEFLSTRWYRHEDGAAVNRPFSGLIDHCWVNPRRFCRTAGILTKLIQPLTLSKNFSDIFYEIRKYLHWCYTLSLFQFYFILQLCFYSFLKKNFPNPHWPCGSHELLDFGLITKTD